MKILARDIMTPEVFTVDPDMYIVDMDAVFLQQNIGGAPVVDRSGKLVGVVSRSDIGRRLAGDMGESGGDDPKNALYSTLLGAGDNLGSALGQLRQMKVRDIMSPEPVSVPPTASIDLVAQLMVDNQIHRILVREEDDLCGIISSLDLVWVMAET